MSPHSQVCTRSQALPSFERVRPGQSWGRARKARSRSTSRDAAADQRKPNLTAAKCLKAAPKDLDECGCAEDFVSGLFSHVFVDYVADETTHEFFEEDDANQHTDELDQDVDDVCTVEFNDDEEEADAEMDAATDTHMAFCFAKTAVARGMGVYDNDAEDLDSDAGSEMSEENHADHVGDEGVFRINHFDITAPPAAPCESDDEGETAVQPCTEAADDDEVGIAAPPEPDVVWIAREPTTAEVFDHTTAGAKHCWIHACELESLPQVAVSKQPQELEDDEDLRLLTDFLAEPRQETAEAPQPELDDMLHEPAEAPQPDLDDILEEAQSLFYEAPAVPFDDLEETVLAAVEPIAAVKEVEIAKTCAHSPTTGMRAKKSSSRTVIGGVVRKPASPTEDDLADARAEQSPMQTSRQSQWLAGSLASGLRPQRRAARFRIDDADGSNSDMLRDSSLTRGYDTLGVEFHSLDRDDHIMEVRRSPAASPNSSSHARFQQQPCSKKSAMALDLCPDAAQGVAPSSHSPMLSSRSTSLGALHGAHYSKLKQTSPHGPSMMTKSSSSSRLQASNMYAAKQQQHWPAATTASFVGMKQGVPQGKFRYEGRGMVSGF